MRSQVSRPIDPTVSGLMTLNCTCPGRQAELELGKQSRTPSPKTLDVKSLLRVETEGNTDLVVSNGVNGHMGNGVANGHHNQMMVCS